VGTAVQTTVTLSEAASIYEALELAMTAVYETDACMALVTVHEHVEPKPQFGATMVLPFRRRMDQSVPLTSWFAVAVRVTLAPSPTTMALDARLTVQAKSGEGGSLVGATGSQGLPALAVGAQSSGSWVVVMT
jgi:hypothetical protein